ncbi:MAG: tyrosine-type recombinase/integrase [Firmicutes bacterium]|nr:tyrosine-type recombinase/integrase [Bacillota bacterium]
MRPHRLCLGGRLRDPSGTALGIPDHPLDRRGRALHDDPHARDGFHVAHPRSFQLYAAGVPRIRIHDLRHSHATWLIPDLPLKTLAECLGHADPRFTARVYQYPGVEAQRVAADQVV